MTTIKDNIDYFNTYLATKACQLLVVTKNQSYKKIQLAYQAGHRLFGENRVQELISKWKILPHDIEWHMIGHLQTNKIKYIVPFISLIHSVDSIKLLVEINKQGCKINKPISCLLQINIAQEDSKFGMSQTTAITILENAENYPFIKLKGLMGMATFTNNTHQIRKEFDVLREFYNTIKKQKYPQQTALNILSMGMSSDYTIAIEMESTMVRIGTAIFE